MSSEFPVVTIRYPTKLLEGSKKWSDGDIMEDIEWHLNAVGVDGASIFGFKKE